MENFEQKTTSIQRILFLLSLLYIKEYNKNELIEEFKKNNISIKKSSIENYIEKLKKYNIPILTKQKKNVNYYYLEKERKYKTATQNEYQAIRETKKLLFLKKNFDGIRMAMRAFYKFAKCTKEDDDRQELIDFGYFSKLNWLLIRKLEECCENKDVILVDYVLPNGKNKYISIHVDELKLSNTSDRLYLSGVFEGDNKFSILP